MKNYSDNKIPKLISRPILGALTAVTVIFVVKLLFDIPPAVHDFIFDTVFVLIIGLTIYRTFFKKIKSNYFVLRKVPCQKGKENFFVLLEKRSGDSDVFRACS